MHFLKQDLVLRELEFPIIELTFSVAKILNKI